MIDKETIDKIYETSDIIEVIGDFVQLKKSGSSYKGLSPFGNEKTPSFMVSPAKRIWKDFSSGKGGNVVGFLMEVEQLTYPEALRYLAKKYNIEIQEKEQTPEDIAAANERESLFLVNAFAEKFFKEQMRETDQGKAIGLSYFRERGFREDIIEKFGLGYSPEAWDALTNASQEAGYKREFMLKAGLIKQKEERFYDFFRGRVIFPIHNITGRPIGFGARTLKKDKKVPKYLNSPETEIYNKSKVLYGMYQAKRAIVQKDNCYLVEGYTDVISLYQSGVENVVASSGTALTTEQVRLIRRFSNNVTILYDGDAAGIRASFRGIDMVLEEGLNVKVVSFPEGEDPDSYAKRVSSSELEFFLNENAKDFIVFKTDLLVADTKGDPVKRSALVREIVNSISLIPDMITRQVYIQECSRLMEIPEQTLISEMNKLRRDRFGKKSRDQKRQDSSSLGAAPPEFANQVPPPEFYDEIYGPVDPQQAWQGQPAPERKVTERSTTQRLRTKEKNLIRMLLSYGDRYIPTKFVQGKVEEELEIPVSYYIALELFSDGIELKDESFQKIIDLYVQEVEDQDNNLPGFDFFAQHHDPDVSRVAVDMITTPHQLSEKWKKHFIFVVTEEDRLEDAVPAAVYSLKQALVNFWRDELMDELEVHNTDLEKATDLMTRIQALNTIRNRFAELLGTVVVE